jgi:hypothetical protein
MNNHYHPSLDKIFSGREAKGPRDTGINTAHMSYGYTLKEIAGYLGIHYTTVSKVIGKAEVNPVRKGRPFTPPSLPAGRRE